MEHGYTRQYRFLESHFKDNEPPRINNVRNVLRAYGLMGKKVYFKHMEQLLSHFPATANANCWRIAHDEIRRYHWQIESDSILRRTLEMLRIPPDPTLGVVQVSGFARTIDSRSLVVELDLGFGAYGGIKHTYPLPEFSHHWFLVRVVDESSLRHFLNQRRLAKSRSGASYSYDAYLYTDSTVGQNEAPIQEMQALIAEPRRRVEVDPKSNFVNHAAAAAEEQAKIDDLARQIQELEDLVRARGK